MASNPGWRGQLRGRGRRLRVPGASAGVRCNWCAADDRESLLVLFFLCDLCGL